MTVSSFKRAVRSVRWSIDRRMQIEEMLQQKPVQTVPIDDLSEEFIETDMLSMDDVIYEEDLIMEKKRHRKIAWIVLIAAALLAAGGTAAAVAMANRGNGTPQPDTSGDISQQIELTDGTLHLNLTAEESAPAAQSYHDYDLLGLDCLAETDAGWYYFYSGNISHWFLRISVFVIYARYQ